MFSGARSVAVKLTDSQHNVLSSNLTSVTTETPLVKKERGNRLIKFTNLEKLRALPLFLATFEIEYATHLKDLQCCKERLKHIERRVK